MKDSGGLDIRTNPNPNFTLTVGDSLDFGNTGTSGYVWADMNTIQERVIKETMTHKIFKLALPEIKREDVNVDLRHDVNGWFIEVTLDTNAENDYLHTFTYNQREYVDPTEYDLSSIEANMKNGSLTIFITKKEHSDVEPRRIEVG